MIDADIAKATSKYGSLYKDVDIDNPLVQSDRAVLRGPKQERVMAVFIATFAAAFGPISFGFCLGYSSSALQDLQSSSQKLHLSSSQGSWFSSLVTVGAMLGGPIAGYLVETIGRKTAIMGFSIPFLVGWLLIAYARHVSMLLIGRFITGIGCGAVSLAVPLYIAETSTARLRGGLGSVNQLAVTMGLLFSYIMGVVLAWDWLAIVGAVPPTLLIIFMFFMPETPRWLLGHNRRHEALKSLQWLRGFHADIEDECCEIESNLDTSNRMTWREFCKPSLTKPLFIGIGLMVFQQFCGVNAVLFNCASIFETAGFNHAKTVAIIIGAVQFVGTAIACLIVDRSGRRVLLLTTSVVMCLSLVALGVYFEIYIPKPSAAKSASGEMESSLFHSSVSHSVPAEKINWLSIMSLIVFNLAFALAWGPIPWLMMSEIFPTRARGIASGITTLSNWLFAFLVTKTFETMVNSITTQGTYWFYGGCMFVSFVFVFFAVPETKGKTLEQIEAYFNSGHTSLYDPIDSNEE